MKEFKGPRRQGGWIGGVISVAAPLIAGSMSADASRSAASTQAGATDRASAVQLDMFNRNKADVGPWVGAGRNALQMIMSGLGIPGGSVVNTGGTPGGAPGASGAGYSMFKPEEIQTMIGSLEQQRDSNVAKYGAADPVFDREIASARAALSAGPGQTSTAVASPMDGMFTKPFSLQEFGVDPSYQWRLDQGGDFVTNKIAAEGGRLGGNALTALTNYSQGAASTEYQSAFSRWDKMINDIFSRLSGVSNTGANAALGSAGIGASVGRDIGSNIIGAGNATGAGIIGANNAMTGGMTGGMNALMQMLNRGGGGSAGYGVDPAMMAAYDMNAAAGLPY